MALYSQTYTIKPEDLPEYPRIFLDTVREKIHERRCESVIQVQDDTHLPTPCVVLLSQDENVLFFLQRAIDSEIRDFPYSYVMDMPQSILDRESDSVKKFREEIAKMQEDRDYFIFETEENGKVILLYQFHRSSVCEYFKKVLGADRFLSDEEDAEVSLGDNDVVASSDGKVVSLAGKKLTRRVENVAQSGDDNNSATPKVVSLDEARKDGRKPEFGRFGLT